MSYTVEIDAVDVGAVLLMPGTIGGGLRIDTNANGVGRATFALSQATSGTLAPNVDLGDPVTITDDASSDILFGGFVHQIKTKEATNNPLGTYTVVHQVTAVDYSGICRHRLVNDVYAGDTLADIVTAIVGTYLTDEGITTTNVATGPTISKVVFAWRTVADAFDTLAEMTGYSWWIDGDKDLHFVDRTVTLATLAFSASSRDFRSLSVSRSLQDYANVVVQKGGRGVTDSQVHAFVGDGARRVFNVAYPVAAAPSLTVNAVAVAAGDVGIRGVDTGKRYYWNKGSTEIQQADGETVLGTGDDLEVTYTGLYDIYALAELDSEIAARAAASAGTSGRYESIQQDASIETLSAANEKAAGYLARFGVVPEDVQFETDDLTLRVGQLMSIELPEYALSGQFLVDRLSMYDRGDGELRTSATALAGPARGGWQAWWRRRMGPAVEAMSDQFISRLLSTRADIGVDLTETAASQSIDYLDFDVDEYDLAEYAPS